MEVSSLVVHLVVLLLPGLIAAAAIDHLTVHRDWSPYYYSVYAILLGGVAYTLLQGLLYVWAAGAWVVSRHFDPISMSFWDSLVDESVPIHWLEILGACGVALGFGVLLSTAIYHKVFIESAQRVGITSKFAEDSLFMHFMDAREIRFVNVRDRQRGFIYEGWPLYFTHRRGIRELVLGNVRVYNYTNAEEWYPVTRVYLSYPDNADVVIEEAPE